MLFMSYISKGAFTVMDLYKMPVYLRNFYYRELLNIREKEQNEIEEATRKR